MNRLHRKLLVLLTIALMGVTTTRAAETTSHEATFLRLSDMAADLLLQPEAYEIGVDRQFYRDSYSVRSMAVAYDITGDERYLRACQFWADQMLAFQAGMIPEGAYYIHYYREPGQTSGSWYLADAASIASAVLSTATRTADPDRRAAYIDSVKAFADLVLREYRKDGGITDGIWEKYDGPWWCSTGIFGSLGFLLYAETGEEKYLKAGYEAIDWLNGLRFDTVKPLTYNIDVQGPSLIMYFFEAYSAGLPYLYPNTARHAHAWAQIDRATEWMRTHLHGLGAVNEMSYNSQWGSKSGGMPFHMYVWSRHLPDGHKLAAEADRELAHSLSIMFDESRFDEDPHELSQLMNFTMFSLAEKLRPGYLYRP